MKPSSPGRVSIPHRKEANKKKKKTHGVLGIHADLASTGMAIGTYVSICHNVKVVKVNTVSSRGAEYLHSAKNDK